MSLSETGIYLENAYQKYRGLQNIADPVNFPSAFSSKTDKELTAFISALFAFGNITAMNKFLAGFFSKMGTSPAEFLMETKPSELKKIFAGFKYRFYSESDITALLHICRLLLKEGGLEYRFRQGYSDTDPNALNMIHHFSGEFKKLALKQNKELSGGLKFMVPTSEHKGAAKRLNLFLRWMVRNDEVDFGLWQWFPKNKLIIPLDTHIYRAALELGLTQRKSPDLRTALEITDALRQFSPEDPLKYDFALCHFMIDSKKNL